MKGKLIAFLVTAVMVIGLPISVRCAAPSVAELLPPDSFGYAELSDFGVFYYLIGELGEAAVLSLEEEAELPGDIKVKGRAMLEAFNEIRPLLPRSVGLGVVSIDPETGGQPSLLLVSELSEALAPVVSAASKLLVFAPNVKVTKTEDGVEVVLPHDGMPPIGTTVRDNVLYAAMGKGLLGETLSRRPSASLAQTANFKAVHAITGKSALLSAYINLDAIGKKVIPILPPPAQRWVELLGVKDLHAAGMSLSADEEMVGFNLALRYTEDAPGIPSLLSLPNTTPKGIAYVPDNFSYVTRFSIGPPAEFMKKVRALVGRAGEGESIDQAFANLKENMGIDMEKILAALGGEITIGVKVPETLEIPEMVLCVEATDPEYLMGTLKTLLAGDAAPASLTEVEVGGRKTMTITPKFPLPVTPVMGVDDDMIVIAVSSDVLQNAFAAKANGKNIASKASFKAAMKGLPADSNVALEYIELEDLGQMIVAGVGLAAGNAPAEAKPMIDKAMQYVNRAFQDIQPGAEVVYRTPGGLAIQSRMGTRSVMQVLKNGAAFAAKAAMYVVARREMSEIEEPPVEAEEVEELTEE